MKFDMQFDAQKIIDRREQYRDRLQVYADKYPIKYLELLLYRKWRDNQRKKEVAQ